MKINLVAPAIAVTLISIFSTNLILADGKAKSNQAWWPDRLDLSVLRHHSLTSDPMSSESFDYAKAFKKLDLQAVKKDIVDVLKTSQDWWPADFGHYGPFMIRMAWHSAGTYRISDGRGGAGSGQQRFEPLNSWPDNANLDKARRLLWPIKQKYGRSLSWADLMILTGNVALESMGFKTYGFGGGRVDAWEADMVYWGPENQFLDDKRYSGDRQLENPLAAVQMGLIYVNPEGPNGEPDPLKAAKDIRETFARMAMNDEETVALIAGGHTFGKAHGAADPSKCLGPEPAAEAVQYQGLGWNNQCGKGNAEDTITSGLEGAWSATPTSWGSQYLDNLFNFEWEKTKSPAGATQWIPTNPAAKELVPDAFVKSQRHAPIMFTTDLALKADPKYKVIAKRFQEDPKALQEAFAKAWYKLTHRDMGPKSRYLGVEVPKETLIWQDPIPEAKYVQINDNDVDKIKQAVLNSDLSISECIRTAWAAAASYRNTDKRGGINGARISLSPQNSWEVNDPDALEQTLSKLKKVQTDFNNKQKANKQVSLADLIVIAGNAAVEEASKQAGVTIKVPFYPGRIDTTQALTDVESFAVLEPLSDGFRNYHSSKNSVHPTEMLIQRANFLDLTVPEMTVLVGGMRVLNANSGQTQLGVFTQQPGVLTNEFFINLLDMSTRWQKSATTEGTFEGLDRKTGKVKWTATSVDLIFGSHSELRAISEFYAAQDAKQKFVQDFAKAWTKVMNLDRFDLT